MDLPSRQLEITLPPIPANRDRIEWRERILETAREAADRIGVSFVDHEKVEIVVAFFLQDPDPGNQESTWPDIDNLVEDAMDALQGALALGGKTRDQRRLIRSDKQVYRLVAEKHHGNRDNGIGGRLLVRPYRRNEWPLW